MLGSLDSGVENVTRALAGRSMLADTIILFSTDNVGAPPPPPHLLLLAPSLLIVVGTYSTCMDGCPSACISGCHEWLPHRPPLRQLPVI
jgi:hypothetical protein